MKQIPGGVTAPKGFRAWGVHCGVKSKKADKKDLALILSDQECAAAAVYTMNRVKAAPLYVTMEHLEDGTAWGVAANSGNANACCPMSHEYAEEMARLAARATGRAPADFVVASTGVIGQTLNIPAIRAGMPEAAAGLTAGPEGSDAAARAIMTTDTVKKELALACSIGGRTVTLGAIAKGSGMIHPNMGTMLCFVTTDCAITREMLSEALREVVPRTFNRVTVDGDTSTNDMCAVLANGMAGNPLIEWKDDGYTVFLKALRQLCQELARAIAGDGEGASRLITCAVREARSEESAERLAKAVVGSPPGEGRHVRRRRKLGPGAVCHGLLQGPLPPRVCGHFLLLRRGCCGRLPGRHGSGLRRGGRPEHPLPGRGGHRRPPPRGRARGHLLGLRPDVRICEDQRRLQNMRGAARAPLPKEANPMSDVTLRAQVLAEALPYIQKYYGKTIVIKYGGSAMISRELREAVIGDVILLSLVGIHVVVVHGGGPEISAMLKKLGKESRFVDGLRCTDTETMDVVQQVLCGKVNKNLAATLNRRGGRAIGLCGLDAGLFQARLLDAKYGLVGELARVDPAPVRDYLTAGYIPVVSTVAQGVDGENAYNINADTAAARLAVALGAEKLILLTDVHGLLRDPADESTLLQKVGLSEVPLLVREGVIQGGMIPKVECCVEAVRSGVERTHILDGRIPHSILIELLSDEGIGTMIL